MKKIFQLIDIKDEELLSKLIYLDRIVRFYSKFLVTWRTAGVFSDGKVVRVKFMNITKHGYESFTEREFPVDAIDERISSYQKKVSKEFKARQSNERLGREKEIHKWKLYIDNAKI